MLQLSSSERLSKTVRSLKRRKLVHQVFEQDIALIESTLRLLNEEDFDRACHAIIIGVAARLGKRSTAILKEIDAAERARAEFTPEDSRI